jgi:hypothetical protein
MMLAPKLSTNKVVKRFTRFLSPERILVCFVISR